VIIAEVAERNWPAGENSGEGAIPDDAGWLRITATRVAWPNPGQVVIEYELWLSTDGVTWVQFAATDSQGGSPNTWLGVPSAADVLTVQLPPGTGRLGRGVFRRLSSLRTAITVEAL